MENKPKVRLDLDFFPVEQGGKKFVFIRDPLGLADGKLIPLHIFQFISQLNGNNTIRDLQVFLTRKMGGVIVGIEEVQNLIKKLDDMFLLDTERYRCEKKKIEQNFAKQKIRMCSHCGKSYPKDPEKLKKMLDKIIGDTDNKDKNIVALIAPHIDISVGEKVYGDVYREIKGLNYSRVIIIGVGHQLTDNLFCLTEKDFYTPLGMVKTDKDGVRSLKKAAEPIISETDFAHKEEHSIEFQLIFLQYLLKEPFKIVPILCGPVKLFLNDYSRKSYLDITRTFIEVLSGLFSEENTLLVAGVDLSHIGPKFGHDRPAMYIEPLAKKHDEALINAILKMEPNSFWEKSQNDRFNVCGFSALACFLEVLIRAFTGRILDYNACVKDIKAKLLNYHIWHEKSTDSAVSFCGIKFLKNISGG